MRSLVAAFRTKCMQFRDVLLRQAQKPTTLARAGGNKDVSTFDWQRVGNVAYWDRKAKRGLP